MTARVRMLVPLATTVLLLALTVAPASAAEVWRTTTVTHASLDQGFVLASTRRLVWSAWDGNAFRVYTWKPSDPRPTKLSGGANPYDVRPRVSGDRVVWQGRDGVYTWTPAGGTVRATDSSQAGDPDVSGDTVVWTQIVGGSPRLSFSDVFMWTPPAGTKRVTADGGVKGNIHISGDRIAWDGMVAVSTMRLGDAAPVVFGGGQVEGNWYNQLFGDRLVWEYVPDKNAIPEERRILSWTPGGGLVTISSGAADWLNWTSAVSGRRIAWARESGAGYDVYTWSANGGTRRLTSGGTAEAGPAVDGDRVVWAAGGAGHRQIYTWTPRTGVVRVSHNGSDNCDPVVAGDRISWRERVGGTYQIVTAVPRTSRAQRVRSRAMR